jgi:hypothetical protein
VTAVLACRTPATEVLVVVGSDAPAERVFTLTASIVGPGGTHAMTPVWVSGSGVVRGITLPASFALTPGAGGIDQPYELQIDASVAAGEHGEPAVAFRRVARFRFVAGQTGVLRIFLSLACGSRANSCTSVPDADCTVAVRCTERGETCGDRGECVPVDVVPTPTTLTDGGLNMSFDVANDVADATEADVHDGGAMDAADVNRADDGASDTGASCGTCAASETCCNGRCTDLATDPTSCGACGQACNGTICVSATCSNICVPGRLDCDSNVVNGCEVDAATDSAHCGSCGNACGPGRPCVAGVCTCPAGRGDCDGNTANGCETDFATSAAHCGNCAIACAAGQSCVAGACSCDTGFADCDMDPSNGCETNLASSAANCGSCGVACAAGFACIAGECVSSACTPPSGECDANPATVCETNLDTSVSNCGSCGFACGFPNATAACRNGVCVLASCAANHADCDGNETNGCEVDLATDPRHCGACATACGSNSLCNSGICVCALGYADCDGLRSNGCESDLRTSVQNCGVCGTSCSASGAMATCTNGSCGFGACTAGFGNCDGLSSNGCEATLDTLTNCGACGRACAGANATASCTGGTCRLTCLAGFADCDGSMANGCEVDTRMDPMHCGSCSTACTTGMACNNGTCGLPAGAEFRASALLATHCHNAEITAIDGASPAGIAVGTTNVFIGGSPMVKLARGNLENAATVATSAYILVTDLRTSNIYALGAGTSPIHGGTNATATTLIPVSGTDGALGTPITLSASIVISSTRPTSSPGISIFSGMGRAIALSNSHAYDIALPSGAVVDLGAMTPPAMNGAGTLPSYVSIEGIAEFAGGVLSIVYVRDATSIARCTVPGGTVTTIATFTNIAAISEITADVARGRWNFLARNTTQFRSGGPGRYVGYCDAVWSPGASACLAGTSMCGAGCVSTSASDANCGACGTSCPSATYCASSACAAVCNSGRVFCTDHCATLASDTSDCGTCGHACANLQVCSAGTCVCSPSATRCSGVCVNLQTDEDNCGACGRSCAGIGSANGYCRSGVCGCISLSQSLCGTNCVSLGADESNCGTCGHVCPSTQICSGGVCVNCPTGEVRCGGLCFDLQTSDTHCGSCSISCPGTQHCVAGRCS